MLVVLRRYGVLGLAGLAVLGLATPQARAQRIFPNTVNAQSTANTFRINPNFYLPNGTSLNQAAYNVGVVGRAYSQIPPYLLGYNPYPQAVSYGPSYPTITTAGAGYGVSTVGSAGYNPYTGSASLATDPSAAYGGYGMSTMPGGYGGGGYGGYYGPGYGPGGETANVLSGYAGYLRGTAALTSATGQYWKDIQSARITREQSRQMALETQRRRIMEEAAYERMKPTAQDLRDRELMADLVRARRDPPPTEVWSGKALNDLLRSVATTGSGKLNRGPNIPLEDEMLRNINVTDSASRANLGLLKDGGNLAWPLSLKEAPFDEARKRLDRNLILAVRQIKDKDPLDRAMLKDIRADFQAMNDRLAASVGDLSPSQYIESRRYLNQLEDAVKALEDPKVINLYHNLWKARGGNVAELMNNMIKDGLRFAPATPGDEGSYSGLYQALRAYEASLQNASKGS